MSSLKIIEYQKRMMTFSGSWPMDKYNLSYKIKDLIAYSFGLTLSLTMLIQIGYCYRDFAKLSEILYITVTMIAFMIKFTTFKHKKANFDELIKIIHHKSFKEDSEYIDGAAKISTMLSIIYRYTCFGCVVTYGLFPVFDHEPFPFPFPFFSSGIPRIIMYCFQTLGIFYSSWNNACMDVLLTGFLLITGAQLDILRKNITDTLLSINKNHNEAQVEIKLKKYNIHHLYIIDFVTNIEELFSLGILAQFFSSIIVICNTGFHFMLIEFKSMQFLNLVFYLAAMLSQLTMYCWYGNEIIHKSLEIRDACYNTNWYELNPRINKYVFLIMERSKRPLVVTAYKFANASIGALTSIMHWSYSYFALLRRLYVDRV